jgi:AcrR family transcriptional regulator
MASRSVGQHHGNLRGAVIKAATDALEQGNETELSMRALARTVGISPGAIYHHFADKSALLDAVAHDGFRRLGRVQARVVAAKSEDHLAALIKAYMRFAAQHPALYRVMFGAVSGPDLTASRETLDAAAETFDHLVTVVSETNGTLVEHTARSRALIIWTLTHGAVELVHWSRRLDPSFTARVIMEETARSAAAIARRARQS